jgi:hypothetical protein
LKAINTSKIANFQINSLRMYLKELEKQEPTPKLVQRKITNDQSRGQVK